MSLVMEWLDDTWCVCAHTHTQTRRTLPEERDKAPSLPTVSLENVHDSSRVQRAAGTPAAALSSGSCHSLHLLRPGSQDTAWQVSGPALRER